MPLRTSCHPFMAVMCWVSSSASCVLGDLLRIDGLQPFRRPPDQLIGGWRVVEPPGEILVVGAEVEIALAAQADKHSLAAPPGAETAGGQPRSRGQSVTRLRRRQHGLRAGESLAGPQSFL